MSAWVGMCQPTLPRRSFKRLPDISCPLQAATSTSTISTAPTRRCRAVLRRPCQPAVSSDRYVLAGYVTASDDEESSSSPPSYGLLEQRSSVALRMWLICVSEESSVVSPVRNSSAEQLSSPVLRLTHHSRHHLVSGPRLPRRACSCQDAWTDRRDSAVGYRLGYSYQ